MTYRIEHAKPHGTQAGAYWYDIYQDDRLIARFWHDLRGDENGIEFIDGSRHPSPIPAVVDFLEGGGAQPLTLSSRAVAYLREKP